MGCRLKLRNAVLCGVIVLGGSRAFLAQDHCGDDCKVNTNVAAVVSVPVMETEQVSSVGWGVVAGAGYNLNKWNAVMGEFLWDRSYDSAGSLQPLQPKSAASALSGTMDVFSVTGNYRLELRGRLVGTYVIGGGGWYLRNTSLSAMVKAPANTPCAPVWLWWGFSCSSGMVMAGQSLDSNHSNALGANLGVGFTVRVGESPYRLYSEARYHYVPYKDSQMEFVAATLGLRY